MTESLLLSLGFGKVAFACDSSEKMTILAGKIDESVVEILTSESGVLRYEEVNGEVVNPFLVDADTLSGSTKEEIISEAQSGVDLSNVDAKTLGGSTKEEIIESVPKVDLSPYALASALTAHTGNKNNPHGVTATQIGAAPSSHTHAASNISAGTLAGKVNANSSAQSTVTTAQLRDIYAGTSDIGAGSSLTSGRIYLVYE